jgi:hypothetical protein
MPRRHAATGRAAGSARPTRPPWEPGSVQEEGYDLGVDSAKGPHLLLHRCHRLLHVECQLMELLRHDATSEALSRETPRKITAEGMTQGGEWVRFLLL